MKITKVECIPLIYPLEKPVYDAIFIAEHRQTALVKVHTDEGVVGIGEAASFGGPLEITKLVIEKEIAPRIIGEDPFNVERIWKKIYFRSWQHGRGGIVICALSGIDIALWDIMGKATNTPLYKLLGGYTNKVNAYASSGFYRKDKDTNVLVEEMKQHVSKGYKAVKMKVGRNHTPMNPIDVMPDPEFHYTLEQDLERVTAVRKAIPSDVKLLVDANAAWDLHTAMTMGREFEKIGVYAFEEPVCTDNIEASSHLARSLNIKIAGYETEQLAYNFKPLIDNNCVDIVQPDLTWGGGITECRKIAAMAYAAHKEIAPHCFSSAITLLTSLHFLCSVPNAGLLEVDQNPNGLREEIVDDLVSINNDGTFTVPEKPGIGYTLNEDAIDKYRV